jgi:parvulin-like peptidyl-prolyl isomerase
LWTVPSTKENPVILNRFRFLALLSLVLLAACSGAPTPTINPLDPALLVSPPAAQQQAPTVPAALPTNSAGVQLVAKVNGTEITLPDFTRALERRQQEVEAATQGALQADVLNQMIEQVLIQQGAKADNIVVTDTQIQDELQSMKDAAGSADAWTQWLVTNEYTEAEFMRSLRSTLLTNAVRDSLTTDLNGDVRQVHARHILVSTEAAANDILARLKAGEDFATLAQALSEDETTRDNGGDLGWFTQEELLVPELAQAAFALQPGQTGGPIATELGYHIVQTLEFADRPVDPERQYYIAQTRFENWLHPLYASATIERYLQP